MLKYHFRLVQTVIMKQSLLRTYSNDKSKPQVHKKNSLRQPNTDGKSSVTAMKRVGFTLAWCEYNSLIPFVAGH